MTDTLSALTEHLLDAARKAGADAADAIAVNGTSVSIDVRAGALEKAERSEGVDIGLRVLVGQRQACVSASDTKPDTLIQMAERAVAMANEAPEDPYAGLADPSQLATQLDTTALEIFDPSNEPDPVALQAEAAAAEAAALRNSQISQVQAASAGYSNRQIHLAATNGFSCVAISGTGAGMERDYDYDSRVFQADMRDAADIGTVAAARDVDRQPATGHKWANNRPGFWLAA